MNKDFDIDKIGKRMPYKVQDNFFNDLENNVAAELGMTNANLIHEETTKIVKIPKKYLHGLRIANISALFAAACMTLFWVLNPKEDSTVDMLNIEQAYANLSKADQDFLMEVYQDDIFLNEQ